jgi:hypothetical protein
MTAADTALLATAREIAADCKRVRVGSRTSCCECDKTIERGEIAIRRQRRAETHRERLHADQNGNVAWYRHEGCTVARVLAEGAQ